jgi:hypothetical protein
MALKDFIWFDRGPSVDPQGNFQPSRRGALSGIGTAMSGVAAPFLGDNDWSQRQAQIEQNRTQADMEFMKWKQQREEQQLQEEALKQYRESQLTIDRAKLAQDQEKFSFERSNKAQANEIDKAKIIADLAAKGIFPQQTNGLPQQTNGLPPPGAGLMGLVSGKFPLPQQQTLPKPGSTALDIPGLGKFMPPAGGVNRLDSLKEKNLESLINTREVGKKFMESVMGGEGNSAPPGSTARFGGVSVPLNKKVSVDESITLTGFEELSNELSQLKEMLGKDKDGKMEWKAMVPFGAMNDETAQRFQLIKNTAAQRIQYLRSGKQINEAEYKRFMELLPRAWRKNSVDMEQLDKFANEFMKIEKRAMSGATWDAKKKEFAFPKNNSLSVDLDSLFDGATE